MSNYMGVAKDDSTFSQITMTGPLLENVAPPLTAKAGGGQSGATLLTGDLNVVTTVATAADSVILPPMVPGRGIVAVNATANSMNVFPAVGEKINGGSANASVAVAAGKATTFYCATAGSSFGLAGA